MNAVLDLLSEFFFLYDILYILVPVVIGVVLIAMKRKASKEEKDMDENRFVVHQGKITTWIGIVCAVLFSAFLALSFISHEEWWVYAGLSAFMLLGVFLTVYSICWEVKVVGDEIRFRSLFKKAKTFTFDQIKTVKVREHPHYGVAKLIIYSDLEKLMYVESHCVGYNLFLARLQQKDIEFVITDEHYGV